MRPADADALVGYRNDPEVARYQGWPLPFTAEEATELLERQADRAAPAPGVWTQCAVEVDGHVVGDVAVSLDTHCGVAEIGFTMAREHQGRGYASEAANAVLEYLVEGVGVGRLVGQLDPENRASARTLERLGLRYETLARDAYWWRGAYADDLVYSATSQEWRAWRDRPMTPPDDVRLVTLTPDNQRAFADLETHYSQQRFVSPMRHSYADALFPPLEGGVPLVPVMYGIEADGLPAGFIMWAAVTSTVPEPYLWRFLVDRRYQGRGIGRRALDLVVDSLRAQGHDAALVSWVPGRGGPQHLYERYGFVPTGNVDADGEVEGRLDLRRRA